MKQYHKNPRQINKKQFAQLQEWLRELGDLSGIVHDLNTDEIIGGNQRSRVFNIDKCKVEITQQFDEPDNQGTVGLGFIIWEGKKYAYRQVRWDDKQCEKANIIANKAGGGWDFDTLANEFEVDDLLDWGFSLEELGVSVEEEQKDAEPQIDRAAELNEKWQVKTGDLWQIGEHRLLCGDSMIKADVDNVMQGEKADMVWTDPPYGVDYEGGAGNKIKREKLSGDDTGDLYSPGLSNLKYACKKSAPMYVWFASSVGKPVYDAIAEIGYEVRAMIVWNKLDAHYGAYMAQYMQKHEPCLYIVDGNANWIGTTNEVTVWDIKQPSRNENHPTEKPVELATRAINNHEAPIVADFFGGSGTCMLASHNLNRKCLMIEKEPKFCAVILERMATAFPELDIHRENTEYGE